VAKIEKKVAQKQQNAIQRFTRETLGEMRKVTWPTRQEAINLTIVVVVVIIAMSAFLGILDFFFSQGFGLIFR
jgi:preprotein translocase subunit SecE